MTMPYVLQMLRNLMDEHPDRAESLRRHVEALELSIESQPAFCLQNVRTLFEAAHHTVAPRLGVTFNKRDGFPDRMRGIIDALDFSIDDHPDKELISTHIKALANGIDDMTVALAKLSNIPNMRHGGSLDWGTLQRQHALMLGGLCDTLVSFLFDVAWSRSPEADLPLILNVYEDYDEFNNYIDEVYPPYEIAGSVFPPSQILFRLDDTLYDLLRIEWQSDREADPTDNQEAAA